MDTEKLGFVLLAQLGVSVAELGTDGTVKIEQLPIFFLESIKKVNSLEVQVTKLQIQVDELSSLTKKLLQKK